MTAYGFFQQASRGYIPAESLGAFHELCSFFSENIFHGFCFRCGKCALLAEKTDVSEICGLVRGYEKLIGQLRYLDGSYLCFGKNRIGKSRAVIWISRYSRKGIGYIKLLRRCGKAADCNEILLGSHCGYPACKADMELFLYFFQLMLGEDAAFAYSEREHSADGAHYEHDFGAVQPCTVGSRCGDAVHRLGRRGKADLGNDYRQQLTEIFQRKHIVPFVQLYRRKGAESRVQSFPYPHGFPCLGESFARFRICSFRMTAHFFGCT